MKKIFNTKKLNVEKIVNKVSQLHIHITIEATKIVHACYLCGWLKVKPIQNQL